MAKRRSIRAMVLGIILGMIQLAGAQVRFKEVSEFYNVRGLLVAPAKHALGHGVAVADLNADDLPDLYVSHAVRDAVNLPELLYVNQGLNPFREKAADCRVADAYGDTGTHGIVFVDIDNDGDLDIFNGSTDAPNHLYINRGNGTFYDGSRAAGISSEALGTRGVVAFDANGDGYMDLFAANWYNPRTKKVVESNEFYLNRGNGSFERVDGGVTKINSLNTGVQGVSAADIDGDGDIDLLLSRRIYPDPTMNQVLLNDGTGKFVEKSRELGLYVPVNDCNGTTLSDIDNDGDLDVLFTNHPASYSNPDYLRVFENRMNETGRFVDISKSVNIKGYGFTVLCIDVDNDADQDIFLTNTKGKSALYLNQGNKIFAPQKSSGAEHYLFDPRAVIKFDFDRDGDLDIYFTDANKDSSYQYYNRLLQNETVSANHWIKLDARGPRGDRGGFGSKAWIYETGHMNEPEFLLGYQEIQNAYGYLAQDDHILHFGLGQHTTCDIKFMMTDGTEFLAFSVPAEQTIYFTKPTDIEIITGDDQSAPAFTPLDHPLKVRVSGSEGNPLAGVPVQFRFSQGGGTLGEEAIDSVTVYTDQQGFAMTSVTLADIPGEHHITATVKDHNLSVSFIASLYLDKIYTLSLVDSGLISAPVDSWLEDSVRVRLVDAQEQPVILQPVIFNIDSGGGVLAPGMTDRAEILTDTRGIAAVAWRMGTSSSIGQKLSVTVDSPDIPVLNMPLEIVVQALPLAVSKLVWMGDSLRSGQAGALLEDPLRLSVSDKFNNPISGVKVQIHLEQGHGLVGGATELIVASQSDGMVHVPWTLGPVAGMWQKISFSVLKHPSILTSGFAFAGNDNAVSLQGMSLLNEYEIKAGETIEPLTVRIVDDRGQPVPDYLVTFSLLNGEGVLNGMSDSVQVITDNQGKAQCSWIPGQGREQIQTLQITALQLLNSPILVNAIIDYSVPHEIRLIQANNLVAGPQTRCPFPIQVAVVDSMGNPVASHPVQFSITEGDVFFDGEKKKTVLTDSLGTADIFLDMGTKAGPISVQALSSYHNLPLVHSPVEIKARLEPGKVDTAKSQIMVSGPAVANGCDQVLVTIKLSDAWENPIGNEMVNFSTLESSLVFPSNMQSDSLGNVLIPISTTLAKTYLIQMATETVQMQDLTVRFIPGPAARLSKISGDGQKGLVNRTLDKLVMVAVSDSFSNAVPDVALTPIITMPSGKTMELETALTDSAGIARWAWPLEDEYGEYTLTLGLNSEEQVRFHAQAMAGVPFALECLSPPDVIGYRGRALSDSFAVKLIDEQGNGLPGFKVCYHVVSGKATFSEPCQVSDPRGIARTGVVIDKDAEQDVIVSASLNDMEIETFWEIHVFDDHVVRVVPISGNHQSARPDSCLQDPIAVQVFNQDNVPVPYATVFFEILQGDGKIYPEQVTTDTLGLAQALWCLGPKDSLQIAKAWTADAEEQEVRFKAVLMLNHVPRYCGIVDTTIFNDSDFVWDFMVEDPDLDAVSLVPEHLPEGMTLSAEPENHYHLLWPADRIRIGEYTIYLNLIDDHGGVSLAELHLVVRKRDHIPQIVRAVPEDSVVYAKVGDVLRFEIVAMDPDGDSLCYSWIVNEQMYAHETGSVMQFTPGNELPCQFYVKGIVSADGKSIERVWLVNSSPTTVKAGMNMPLTYDLYQNYPNPFNPSTIIGFMIPVSGLVRLEIFNANGQKVRSLVHQSLSPGEYFYTWDGCDDFRNRLPSGIYTFQLRAPGFVKSKQLTFIK